MHLLITDNCVLLLWFFLFFPSTVSIFERHENGHLFAGRSSSNACLPDPSNHLNIRKWMTSAAQHWFTTLLLLVDVETNQRQHCRPLRRRCSHFHSVHHNSNKRSLHQSRSSRSTTSIDDNNVTRTTYDLPRLLHRRWCANVRVPYFHCDNPDNTCADCTRDGDSTAVVKLHNKPAYVE